MTLLVHDNDDINDPHVRSKIGLQASIVCIVCNTVLCAGKMVIGVIAGSVSIIADAVNNLSDASSNIISLFGFKLSTKPPDAEHPYGHGRYEYLAGLIVSVLILVIGIELLRSSIEKLTAPTPVEFSWELVAVLVLAICVKFWMMFFNRSVGKSIKSETLLATAADSRNDCITTGAVLVAAFISYFTGVQLDAWMGLAVALFILWSGFGLVRDTIDPLLGGPPDPELVNRISNKVKSYDGILGIHDLMVHDYGPGRQFASFHAEVPAETDVLKSHEIIDDLEKDFRENEGLEVVVHLDPIVTSDPRVAELRKWVSGLVKAIDPQLTIHDFRMVPGDSHTNLIFDCVRTHGLKLTDDELVERIGRMVKDVHPDYNCVITVDSNYTSTGSVDK